MVEINPDMKAALEKTNELVSSADRPIFEATFAYDGVLVRVDILTPEMTRSGKVSWHIAEVKSSGSVCPSSNYLDFSFITYQCEGESFSLCVSMI